MGADKYYQYVGNGRFQNILDNLLEYSDTNTETVRLFNKAEFEKDATTYLTNSDLSTRPRIHTMDLDLLGKWNSVPEFKDVTQKVLNERTQLKNSDTSVEKLIQLVDSIGYKETEQGKQTLAKKLNTMIKTALTTTNVSNLTKLKVLPLFILDGELSHKINQIKAIKALNKDFTKVGITEIDTLFNNEEKKTPFFEQVLKQRYLKEQILSSSSSIDEISKAREGISNETLLKEASEKINF